MTPADILDEIHSKINFKESGNDRYFIRVPLTFPDGDHYVIILKKEGRDWILTDEGNTLMHVGILKDIGGGFDNFEVEAAQQIKTILDLYDIEDRKGCLVVNTGEERFGGPGQGYFDMMQAITDIMSIKKKDPRWRGSYVEHKVSKPWKYEDHIDEKE